MHFLNTFMDRFMNRLPEDTILHIAGFYGLKIPPDLAKEINDQKILYAIKESEYYNDAHKTWHNGVVLTKFLDNNFVSDKFRILQQSSVWKDWDRIVNKVWRSFTSEEREEIVNRSFSECRNKQFSFITGSEFIKYKCKCK
jgi:hypothetical protein